ncbi:MAG: cytochrome c [Leptospiraceae bacterium]|nr:cytochrome c [Leptospiraceae bacterium]
MNRTKSVFCFLVFGLLLSCSKKSPAWQYFPDMYDSPAVEAQEFDPTAPNKLGGRIPPEGTIPVEYEPYEHDSIKTYTDVPNGGPKIPESIRPTLANYKKGEDKYQTFCYPCHGARGMGNGPVVGPSPKVSYIPNMNLVDKSYLAVGMTDGQIYHVISRGNGLMPSYGAQIEPEDRWKIVLYLRKLQENYAKATPEEKK